MNNKDIFQCRSSPLNYTEEQTTALNKVAAFLKSNDNFFLLVGYAGTGKTSICENIAIYADARIAAPTNTAVKRLKEKLTTIKSENFSTIHQLIYGYPDEKGVYVVQASLTKNKVYLIDEASMISKPVLDDLMKEATKANSKIIFVGDGFQLQPVGVNPMLFSGKMLKEMFAMKWMAKLTTVMRQDGSILKAATHIRQSEKPELLAINDAEFSILPKFSNQLLVDIKEENNHVILVSTNKTRIAYNKQIRKIKFGAASETSVALDTDKLIAVSNSWYRTNGETYTLSNPEVMEELRLLLINPGHAYPDGLYADTYLIEHDYMGKRVKTLLVPELTLPSIHEASLLKNKNISSNPAFVTFKGRYPVWKKEVTIATYGYAITTHKSQGSEWDNVYINCDWLANDGKSNWLYTAITRAKKKVEVKNSNMFKIIPNV